MSSLDGKVAIITGATAGIGDGIAEYFAQHGATVVAAGRRDAEGAALERRTGVTFIRTDVTVENDVRALVARTVEKFGRLDCIVNNAGTGDHPASIADLDMAEFDRVMSVNIRGLVMCMKHAAGAMIPRGSGSIVNVSSIAGSRAALTSHPYSASKGAVLAVTRSAAAELGEKGIRVNAISPGGIVTDAVAHSAGLRGEKARKVMDAVRGLFATMQPIRRSGEAHDIAAAAAFLASDEAGFINGHDFIVDGGLTASRYGWSEGQDFRGELRSRMKAAADSA